MEDLRSAGKVLVCLRYGIGDLVMETPGLAALRAALPAARIDVLGARPATDLLMRDRVVDGIFPIQEFGFLHWGDESSPRNRDSFKHWLRGRRYDAVLDPSHAAHGVNRAIWEHGGPLFDAKDEHPDDLIVGGGSGVEAIKRSIRRGWGIPVPADATPRIRIGLRDRLWAAWFLRGHLQRRGPLVALSPAGSSLPKIWPFERVVRLGERLLETGFSLVLLGGAEIDRDPHLAALSRSDRVLAAHGMHLLRVSALLGECHGLVCNDTGMMHVAAAVGIPVVALFGPTRPSIYLPRQGQALALTGDRPGCEFRENTGIRPSRCQMAERCLNGEESCICAIGVEDVLSACEEMFFGGDSPCREGLCKRGDRCTWTKEGAAFGDKSSEPCFGPGRAERALFQGGE